LECFCLCSICITNCANANKQKQKLDKGVNIVAQQWRCFGDALKYIPMTFVLQGYTDLELLSHQCEQMIHHALTIDISVESLLKLQVCNAALLTAAESMHPLLHVITHIRLCNMNA